MHKQHNSTPEEKKVKSSRLTETPEASPIYATLHSTGTGDNGLRSAVAIAQCWYGDRREATIWVTA
jgi:hypothetical protein